MEGLVTGGLEPESLWTTLSSQARASGRSGDMTGIIELFKERIEQKQLPTDQMRQVGVIIHNMADLVKRRGDVRGAIDGYAEAARYYRMSGDQSLLQHAIGLQVDGLMTVGDYQRAVPLAAERAQICRDTGDRESLLNATAVQGKLLHWAGDSEHAAEIAEMQQEMAEDLGDDAMALTLANRGLLYIAENNLDEADSLLSKAVAMLRAGNNHRQLANTVGSYAFLQFQRGNITQSIELQREAESLCRKIDDKEGLAKSLAMQGLALSQLGQVDQARTIALEADLLARSQGLTSLADDLIKPVLAMCGPRGSTAAGGDGHVASAARQPAPQDDYEQRLAEWQAMPWLKRMRTPKPSPPAW